MKGNFHKKYLQRFYFVLFLSVGILMLGLMTCLLCFGENASPDDLYVGVPLTGGLGVLLVSLAVACFGLPRSASLQADEDGVSARCHVGGRLSCRYEELSDVWLLDGAMIIATRKGKKYRLFGLLNMREVRDYIKSRIPVTETENSVNGARALLLALKRKMKRSYIFLAVFFALVFVFIILGAVFTDGKEMSEFLPNDWIVFTVSISLAALSFILFALFCVRVAKNATEYKRREEGFVALVLRSSPLPEGEIQLVFLDSEVVPTYRIVIFKEADSSRVYYIIEAIDKNTYTVKKLYRSKFYPSLDALFEDEGELVEIHRFSPLARD